MHVKNESILIITGTNNLNVTSYELFNTCEICQCNNL